MRLFIKDGFFYAALILFAVILFHSAAQTVWGQTAEKQERLLENGGYDKMEAAYLAEVRAVLKTEGLADAGVTMTRVSEADGSRSYEVKLHHRRLGMRENSERQALLERLSHISFPADNCRFTFQIF